MKLEAVPFEEPQWMLREVGTEFSIIAMSSQKDDEANMKRLAMCWNKHDELVRVCKEVLECVEGTNIFSDWLMKDLKKALKEL